MENNVDLQNNIMNRVAPIVLARHNIHDPLFSKRYIFWLGFSYAVELTVKTLTDKDIEVDEEPNSY